LRQRQGVGLHRMVYLCHLSQEKSFMIIRDQLVSDGYLEVTDAYMRLTPKGQIIENEVVVALMGGLEGDHRMCGQHKDNT